MRTYKLTVAYDGSRFRGWQRQPDTELTIQGILEKQISNMTGYDVEVNGSGRTDGGVHAKGQTASVVLSGKVDVATFLPLLNEHLPEDVRVLRMELVKNGFHARYSARGKCYEYTVDTAEKADVFTRKYVFHYPLADGQTLDFENMRRAAQYLLGTHDFAAFTDRPDEKSNVRRIDEICIIREPGNEKDSSPKVDDAVGAHGAGEEYNAAVEVHDAEKDCTAAGKFRIRYRGSGFLYHMVRILTGTLLEVGMRMRSPESIKRALESGKRSDSGFLAPACGLCLMEVHYGKGSGGQSTGEQAQGIDFEVEQG